MSYGNINIGNDVWIASDAMIMSGVTVGNGAVIAARSVVTRDIPPYHFAYGAPARTKPRFPKEDIEFLEEIQWWNWEVNSIRMAAKLLSSGDIPRLRQVWDRVKGHATVI